MANRQAFEDKYRDLPLRWKIDEDIVSYIIRRYTKKLEEELEALRNNEIVLPNYYRDRRSDEEYVYDLIDGWLIEDIICDAWLQKKLKSINDKIKIKQMGTNRDRTLQKFNPRKITTNPDFVYESHGSEVKIELQMARNVRKAGYDMKQTKVERSIRDGNIFLWVIIPLDSYFICNPQNDLKGLEPIANPLWGGKMVYRLDPTRLESIGLNSMLDSIPKKYYEVLKLH